MDRTPNLKHFEDRILLEMNASIEAIPKNLTASCVEKLREEQYRSRGCAGSMQQYTSGQSYVKDLTW